MLIFGETASDYTEKRRKKKKASERIRPGNCWTLNCWIPTTPVVTSALVANLQRNQLVCWGKTSRKLRPVCCFRIMFMLSVKTDFIISYFFCPDSFFVQKGSKCSTKVDVSPTCRSLILAAQCKALWGKNKETKTKTTLF